MTTEPPPPASQPLQAQPLFGSGTVDEADFPTMKRERGREVQKVPDWVCVPLSLESQDLYTVLTNLFENMGLTEPLDINKGVFRITAGKHFSCASRRPLKRWADSALQS